VKRVLALLILLSVAVSACSERNVYPVSPSAPDSCAADSVKGHDHGPKK